MIYTSSVQHAMPYESSNGLHKVNLMLEVSAVFHHCFPLNHVYRKALVLCPFM